MIKNIETQYIYDEDKGKIKPIKRILSYNSRSGSDCESCNYNDNEHDNDEQTNEHDNDEQTNENDNEIYYSVEEYEEENKNIRPVRKIKN